MGAWAKAVAATVASEMVQRALVMLVNSCSFFVMVTVL